MDRLGAQADLVIGRKGGETFLEVLRRGGVVERGQGGRGSTSGDPIDCCGSSDGQRCGRGVV